MHQTYGIYWLCPLRIEKSKISHRSAEGSNNLAFIINAFDLSNIVETREDVEDTTVPSVERNPCIGGSQPGLLEGPHNLPGIVDPPYVSAQAFGDIEQSKAPTAVEKATGSPVRRRRQL
jgi:hypothetical protein